MNENVYAATTKVADTTAVPAAYRATFYVVSARKFTVLYLATFGLYGIFWFFKQWSCYRQSVPGTRAWPVARAIFEPFFVYALLGKVKAAGAEVPAVDAWRHAVEARRLTMLLMLSWTWALVGDRIDPDWNDPLQLVVFVLVLPLKLRVQAMINLTCGDADGSGNSRLTVANYVWIAIGIGLWVLGLMGTFGLV